MDDGTMNKCGNVVDGGGCTFEVSLPLTRQK